MHQRIELIGEPQGSPTEGQPGGMRALVRVTTPRQYSVTPHVAFGVARNQGIDGGWVVRVPCRTLRAAQEAFATKRYP